jgi:hypothetical protein
MKRHLKPLFAGGMLILYTGMMLFGQSLHALLGCEHDHAWAEPVAQTEGQAPGEFSSAIVAGEQHLQEADSCPICQFQAQGQLAPSLPACESRRLIVTDVPLQTPLLVASGVAVLHSPRGPPSV